MVRCFCCDLILSDDTPPDHKTGRFYCEACFAPTNEVLLALLQAEAKQELEGEIQSILDTLELLEEDIPYSEEDVFISEDEEFGHE